MEFWSSCIVELNAEPAEGPPVPSGRGLTYAQGTYATYEKNV